MCYVEGFGRVSTDCTKGVSKARTQKDPSREEWRGRLDHSKDDLYSTFDPSSNNACPLISLDAGVCRTEITFSDALSGTFRRTDYLAEYPSSVGTVSLFLGPKSAASAGG